MSLARLDADLRAVRKAIQDMMQGYFSDRPGGLAVAQYRAPEEAIHKETQDMSQTSRPDCVAALPTVASPTPLATKDGPAKFDPDMALGAGRWTLRDNGWTLVVPDSDGLLALSGAERSILLHQACSSEHSISQKDLSRILGLPVAAEGSDANSGRIECSIISDLRRRVRALGHRLPLRAAAGVAIKSHALRCRRGPQILRRVPRRGLMQPLARVSALRI
jgi:hypothetical protein